ncbi:MAG: FAD-dependent oxidoreductase [Chloroflexota bacterium]|nr:MAG: FAD-dependent oxidoreductase [Chloroflexota bacterium]
MNRVVVIGAGFGGLAAAAELSRRGFEVTVLEAHVYPGGSAGTFFHQGYRFDAGATLAGGFAPGSVMDKLGRQFDIDWQHSLTDIAMLIHLADGSSITRWTEPEAWRSERVTHFGKSAEQFWDWQENTADALWDLTLRLPPWPVQSSRDTLELIKKGFAWMRAVSQAGKIYLIPSIFSDAFKPVSAHLPREAEKLRQFIDAQLLISAQTTSRYANALYSSAALDLARQGVAHVPGGMGGMADKLTTAVRQNGGNVYFRQEVTRVRKEPNGSFIVETKRKTEFPADIIIFNLPPWNIARILTQELPARLRDLPHMPKRGWGAFMVYIGLDRAQIPNNLPLHHQVIVQEPIAEGNSIFMSLSPEWDKSRAPAGKRALTISTHTQLQPWWELQRNDPVAYAERKDAYTERIISAAERVIPNLRTSAELVLPGTPLTFERFTRRAWGWVGGFPQTSLFQTWGPHLSAGLWMVGDSIFPGQSVPAVMLAGVRVARSLEVRESVVVLSSKKTRFLRSKQFRRVN